MENQDLLHYYENFSTFPNQLRTSRNATLNPWTENESANPYLNMKSKMPKLTSKPTSLKKLQVRQKSISLSHSKSTNHLAAIQSREVTDQNKISKQLPKLNIGHGLKNDIIKKKKVTQQFAKRFILNSSPLYFSSPTLNKHGIVHNSQDLTKRTKVFPTVSRELDVTRKIYLLQNKMSSTATNSPEKRTKFFAKQDNDIRRLVEKQWAKKV